ncbi:hypothetical protein INR75_18570 [Zunongwangia sp. SCSIO 43204]|uniref:hypothetical protein n=1 Tax=Zunongwangia sp. SCSIO 43204 TaxID=2779359 RepID=UPI001CAA15DD|nr:hypothetical protein [Zunongwangia sp. SCSIO 43204]UAB84142.1 hypothetical protein INR75_18570 [Zunongwangia sp. SCSIO 43204]
MKYEPENNDESTIAVIEKHAYDWLVNLEIIDFELLFYKSYLQEYDRTKTPVKKNTLNSLILNISEQIEQNKFHLRTCLFYKNRVSKIRECDDLACEQIYLDAHSLFKNRLQDHFKQISLLKHQIISKTIAFSALNIDELRKFNNLRDN